jgi:hypothetical protein
MNLKNVFLPSLILFTLILPACKQRKAIQQTKDDSRPIAVPASFSLRDSMVVHRFQFGTLSAKLKADFKGNDGSDYEFMITMRAVADSVIWMSVSPALGIEAARILFTRDSIKIMDKIKGRYAIESYAFLKQFTEADITFEMLQNILVGNAALLSETVPVDSVTRYYYTHFIENTLLQELTVNKMFRVLGNIITEQTTQDKIDVNYGDYQQTTREYFPFSAKIVAFSKGKSATIGLTYSSVTIDVPVETKFNIPSGYTKMSY